MKILTLKKEAQNRLSLGHLWIFSNEIDHVPSWIESGDIVEFRDFRGNFTGKGVYNKKSLIAGRILTFQDEKIDYDFFVRRIRSAITFREEFFGTRNSLRLVFSESDLLPGIIIDKYDRTLVVQSFCLGMDQFIPDIVKALLEIIGPRSILQKSPGYFRQLEGAPDICRWEYGEEKAPVIIEEWGLKYKTDIAGGHKTGFYFDQSENHFFIRGLAKDKKVIDCFSYTGAFALNAAAAGASRVIAVEESESAISLARENADLNKLNGINFVKGDVFEFMEKTREKFDLVILDPPSFAKNKKSVPAALKGYAKLNELAFRIAAEGGIVLSASCSHHISREDLISSIKKAAAKSCRIVHLLGWRGASVDHPVYVPMPETEYLKMAVLRVE